MTFPVPTMVPAAGRAEPPAPALPAEVCTGGGTAFALPTNPPADRLSPPPLICTGGGITFDCRFVVPSPPRVPIP